MDDGCLDMDRAFHVGCRGSVKSPDVLREDREQGWTTIGQHHMVITLLTTFHNTRLNS